MSACRRTAREDSGPVDTHHGDRIRRRCDRLPDSLQGLQAARPIARAIGDGRPAPRLRRVTPWRSTGGYCGDLPGSPCLILGSKVEPADGGKRRHGGWDEARAPMSSGELPFGLQSKLSGGLPTSPGVSPGCQRPEPQSLRPKGTAELGAGEAPGCGLTWLLGSRASMVSAPSTPFSPGQADCPLSVMGREGCQRRRTTRIHRCHRCTPSHSRP